MEDREASTRDSGNFIFRQIKRQSYSCKLDGVVAAAAVELNTQQLHILSVFYPSETDERTRGDKELRSADCGGESRRVRTPRSSLVFRFQVRVSSEQESKTASHLIFTPSFSLLSVSLHRHTSVHWTLL